MALFCSECKVKVSGRTFRYLCNATGGTTSYRRLCTTCDTATLRTANEAQGWTYGVLWTAGRNPHPGQLFVAEASA